MYVFVSYSIKHGRGWLPQTTIFWRHEDVAAFCKNVNIDKKRRLIEVFLLVSDTRGTGHRWDFVPIREIFIQQDDESDGDFPLYVSADGGVVGGLSFGESGDVAEIANRESLEKVFPV
jgi:hypothetical protein